MNERTTSQVVGENLRRVRLAAGHSQGEAAECISACGLPWTRDNVASLETRRREPVTINELLALSAAYEVQLAEWFKGDGEAQIAGHVTFSCAEVRDALTGSVPGRKLIPLDFTVVKDTQAADRRAAQRLGVDVGKVSHAATALWGRTLTQERDHRLGEVKDPAAARTLRAGITKRLIREIAPHIKGSES